MQSSFSIARSRFSSLSDDTLRAEIQSHTGSDDETSSILRCLERFGDDLSIQYYEMTPRASRQVFHVASRSSWTVHAVR